MPKKQRFRNLATRAGSITKAGVARDPISIDQGGSVRIDLEALAAPANVYDADFAWVQERHGAISLFFAKQQVNASALRTRIEIRYAYEPFVDHLWKNSREFHERLKKYTTRFQKNETRDALDPAHMNADKEHSDWANFEVIAHSGTQASLDFFRLPTTGIARFVLSKSSSGLVVDPILRVNTTADELCRLLDMCDPIAERVKAFLPSAGDTV